MRRLRPLTINNLYRSTPRARKNRADYVRLAYLKKGFDKNGNPFAAARTWSSHRVLPTGRVVRQRNRPKYVSVITFFDRRYRCRVSCSCPDFVYSGAEWVLAQFGSAVIEYGNGEAPDITNPGRRKLICKHLVALYLEIKHLL